MDHLLANNLYKYAKGNAEKIAKLESWQELALLEIVGNKGAQLASTSANGVSVAFTSTGMSNQDWFNTLTSALNYINQGGPITRTVARIS